MLQRPAGSLSCDAHDPGFREPQAKGPSCPDACRDPALASVAAAHECSPAAADAADGSLHWPLLLLTASPPQPLCRRTHH
jgi:hypothetical protein